MFPFLIVLLGNVTSGGASNEFLRLLWACIVLLWVILYNNYLARWHQIGMFAFAPHIHFAICPPAMH